MVDEKNTIKDSVKELIHKGELRMKPKWYFILKSVLNIFSIVIIFFATLYLIAFISFVMREKMYLRMAPPGVGQFTMALPWIVVLFSLFLLIVLEILVRKYSFVYKRPLAYTLFFLVFLVVLMSLIIYQIDKKDRFPRFGERNKVFVPMHKYYRGELKDREIPLRELRLQKLHELQKMK